MDRKGMFMYEDIKNIIKKSAKTIDEETLNYFTNYFYVLVNNNLISPSVKLEDLIANALTYASKVVFYDETHSIYHKLGKDTKGLRDPDTKTIFIRSNLEEPLREITIYHELHHAVQTNPQNDQVGINQESNIGRLIMEAQTQYFAEKVYEEIHNIKFPKRQIPSENIRMQAGGTIVSKLHNYEMYDCLLSKLAIMLDVPKDYFVSINFLYQDGLKDLEEKYNLAKEKYNLPYRFNDMLYILDYIYVIDFQSYIENSDKQIILSGQETAEKYEIHPERGGKLSQRKQKELIDNFDRLNFLRLYDNNGNYQEFIKYFVDNNFRIQLETILGKNILESPENNAKTR